MSYSCVFNSLICLLFARYAISWSICLPVASDGQDCRSSICICTRNCDDGPGSAQILWLVTCRGKVTGDFPPLRCLPFNIQQLRKETTFCVPAAMMLGPNNAQFRSEMNKRANRILKNMWAQIKINKMYIKLYSSKNLEFCSSCLFHLNSFWCLKIDIMLYQLFQY